MATVATSLNVAKITTAALIFLLIGIYGLSDLRKIVYSSLHLSYLTWWFVHQWVAPGWLDICFGSPLPNIIDPATIIGIYGVFYALPAWCAFTNTSPMLPAVAILSTILFSTGSAINISADLYKTAQKQAGVKKVTSHIYDGRLGAHPNHVGDWMRYSSFALASGTFLAWLIPALIVFFNLKTVRERAAKSPAKDS
ncbi:hypothetical protein WJX74_001678 [Apatococcus lobatus]|uniref:Uncharacterized protein n=1 Tax=Apatococcus lobatus TaxID=904363 RepID=A0AAW1RFE5_9CHLO